MSKEIEATNKMNALSNKAILHRDKKRNQQKRYNVNTMSVDKLNEF